MGKIKSRPNFLDRTCQKHAFPRHVVSTDATAKSDGHATARDDGCDVRAEHREAGGRRGRKGGGAREATENVPEQPRETEPCQLLLAQACTLRECLPLVRPR